MGGLEPVDHLMVIIIVVYDTSARREDPDASLPGADLTAEASPRAVAGDAGCIGTLGEDEQHVGRAVPVEASRGIQHALPVVAGDEIGDRGLQLCVELAKTVLLCAGLEDGHKGISFVSDARPMRRSAGSFTRGVRRHVERRRGAMRSTTR